MAHSVLVVYASRRGSARDAAEEIAETLRDHRLDVDLLPAGEVEGVQRYGAVVLGGALNLGRWHHDARRFLKKHRGALARMPVAAFAVGPHDPEEAVLDEYQEQLERALAAVPEVEPVTLGVFSHPQRSRLLAFAPGLGSGEDGADRAAIRTWAEDVATEIGA